MNLQDAVLHLSPPLCMGNFPQNPAQKNFYAKSKWNKKNNFKWMFKILPFSHSVKKLPHKSEYLESLKQTCTHSEGLYYAKGYCNDWTVPAAAL